MCVLDYAVLVISGTDGVQSHTYTLWKLLRKYEVPVFIFVNKMDLIGADKSSLIEKLGRCDQDFYESFAGNIMKQTGIPRLKDLPKDVEVTTRTNGLDDYIFFFNNSENEADIELPKAMYSIINGNDREQLKLKPYDMEIVRK